MERSSENPSHSGQTSFLIEDKDVEVHDGNLDEQKNNQKSCQDEQEAQFSSPSSNRRAPHPASTSGTQHHDNSEGTAEPIQHSNTSIRSPYILRQKSTYPLNGAQLAAINRESHANPPSIPEYLRELPTWECSGCRKHCQPKESRLCCSVCPNYNLCLICEENQVTSKGHLHRKPRIQTCVAQARNFKRRYGHHSGF